MGLKTDEALVVELADLREADRIVAFLTREHGLQRAVARGARRKHSRFGGELQLLARGRVTWFDRGRDLVSLSDFAIEEIPQRWMGTLEGLLEAGYVADHLRTFSVEGQADPALFRLGRVVVDKLEAHGSDPRLLRYFETWALRLAGVFPAPRECPSCSRPLTDGAILVPSGEGLLCLDCGRGEGGGRILSPSAIQCLLAFDHLGPDRLLEEDIPLSVLDEVEAVCGEARRAFLQRELRSYRVLRDTLATLPRETRTGRKR